MGNTRTVFFSWQSSNGLRQTVENRVRRAVRLLNEQRVVDLECIEHGVEYDSDVKDVPGMRPIFDTIKDKVRSCSVYVADLTPVEIGGRYFPNPNVLIELGYAMAVKKPEQILMLCAWGETYDFDITKWPFDLRHFSAPIIIGHDNRAAKDKSDKQIAEALRMCLAHADLEEKSVFSCKRDFVDPLEFLRDRSLSEKRGPYMPTNFTSKAYFFTYISPEYVIQERTLGHIRDAVGKSAQWNMSDVVFLEDFVLFSKCKATKAGYKQIVEGLVIFRNGEVFLFQDGDDGVNIHHHERLLKQLAPLYSNLFGVNNQVRAGVCGVDGWYVAFQGDRPAIYLGGWVCNDKGVVSRNLKGKGGAVFWEAITDVLEGCGNIPLSSSNLVLPWE